jgi:DNA-binding response OmpR family regulator
MKDIKNKILIVEDHRDLAENLFEFLGEQEYALDFAADGLTALHLLSENNYDTIILDAMLPGVNGFNLCKRIRNDLCSSTPIIFMTALDSIEHKTEAFSNGADDYLVKPFNMKELKLRIDALCKRNRQTAPIFSAQDIQYNPGTLTVSLDNKTSMALSGYSATIFEALIKAYPNYISYESLSERLWGNGDGDPHTIRTHVYSLRKTLKTELGKSLIKTIHGRGYLLDPSLV